MLDISSYVETLNETQCCVCMCVRKCYYFILERVIKRKLRRKKKLSFSWNMRRKLEKIIQYFFYKHNIYQIHCSKLYFHHFPFLIEDFFFSFSVFKMESTTNFLFLIPLKLNKNIIFFNHSNNLNSCVLIYA